MGRDRRRRGRRVEILREVVWPMGFRGFRGFWGVSSHLGFVVVVFFSHFLSCFSCCSSSPSFILLCRLFLLFIFLLFSLFLPFLSFYFFIFSCSYVFVSIQDNYKVNLTLVVHCNLICIQYYLVCDTVYLIHIYLIFMSDFQILFWQFSMCSTKNS